MLGIRRNSFSSAKRRLRFCATKVSMAAGKIPPQENHYRAASPQAVRAPVFVGHAPCFTPKSVQGSPRGSHPGAGVLHDAPHLIFFERLRYKIKRA